jgi:uncharacterized protein
MNSEQQAILAKTQVFVKQTLAGQGGGHDWWHVYRVWKMAQRIGREEHADMFVVELGAFLHDIADWKFHDGDYSVGPKAARAWLESISVDEKVISLVCDMINDISFKGAGVATPMNTLEGKVVQDADRLDALGAIGIARTFAYGGHAGHELYNPESKPTMHASFDAYKKSNSSSFNHFYEKILLLKDLMNTDTAKLIAAKRHTIVEQFLKHFLEEWDGKDH